jgi:hypothetical protein
MQRFMSLTFCWTLVVSLAMGDLDWSGLMSLSRDAISQVGRVGVSSVFLRAGWWCGVTLLAALVSGWRGLEGETLFGLTLFAITLLGGLPAYEAGLTIWPWVTTVFVKGGAILVFLVATTVVIHGLPVALFWAVWKVARVRVVDIHHREELALFATVAIAWPW